MKAATDRRIWRKAWARFGLGAAILIAAFVARSSWGTSDLSDNVHGAVLAWAQQNPGENVPVIIQTKGETDSVADLIRSSGGTVNREFEIIPAIEAHVPSRSVVALASHPSVTWVSLDAPVVSTGAVNTDNLVSAYPLAVGADVAWNQGATGKGIGVAVLDTGISPSAEDDLRDPNGVNRVIAQVKVNPKGINPYRDYHGHGTHIAGIIGGDGSWLQGKYIGIAPAVNLISVKVSDDEGNASVADVLAGLEWVYKNRAGYNIKVVNLSLHSTVAQSYKVDPLDAAVEFLWFNKVFVVVAAGNLGSASDAVLYSPANDPFVLTVGAFNDLGTGAESDDELTSWSSRGTTQDGFAKPELLAPGKGIVSTMSLDSILYRTYPERIVDAAYFRLSGTSASTGVMSGVAALVLEGHPNWTPGELKCTLIATSREISGTSIRAPRAGAAANAASPACNSDAGLAPSTLLEPIARVGMVAYVLAQPEPSIAAAAIGLDLDAVGVKGAKLDNVDWSTVRWDVIRWDVIRWDVIRWDVIRWDVIRWDVIRWDSIGLSGAKFSSVQWDTVRWAFLNE